VVGSAGAGKSVLLSSWAAARSPGVTSWLSCDKTDANPVRFWAGFIEAPKAMVPEFGADAADLLPADGSCPVCFAQHGKTHLRSVYQKLGVASRAEAIERAIDLRLL
jgi:ATP/maltotriose-dependent transcriptional regulator MalT